MAQNFIDEDTSSTRLSYSDGFRFGFGFFIANLLGITVLGGLVLGVNFALHQLH